MTSEAKRSSVPDATAMTTVFDASDLLTQVIGLISDKYDRIRVSYVCKRWREVSEMFPTWKKARFHVTYEDGPHLELLPQHWTHEPSWEASVTTIKEMLTYRKHITQYSLYCQIQSNHGGQIFQVSCCI